MHTSANGAHWSLSLNEVETVALKATRGAGYPWGLAEEASFACRWLAAHGLPWARPLLSVLETADGLAAPSSFQATPTAASLAHRSGPLCPLRLGAYLADLGASPERPVSLGPVAAPVLVVPFLAGSPGVVAVDALSAGIPSTTVWVGRSGLRASDEALEALAAMAPAHLKIAPADRDPEPRGDVRTASHTRSTVPREWLDALARYEAMTYVPASAHSRLAGAGAGLDDND